MLTLRAKLKALRRLELLHLKTTLRWAFIKQTFHCIHEDTNCCAETKCIKIANVENASLWFGSHVLPRRPRESLYYHHLIIAMTCVSSHYIVLEGTTTCFDILDSIVLYLIPNINTLYKSAIEFLLPLWFLHRN